MRLQRALRRGALALVVACATAEASFRLLLFTDLRGLAPLAARVRNPALFSHWQTEEAAQLRVLFMPPEVQALPNPVFDAELGWLKRGVKRTEAGGFRHRDDKLLGGRRPVLLYGDSFAACSKEAGICWEDLLEESPLGRDLHLINLGVEGYGIDQVLLLARASLPSYADRDPLVIVGILVDDDLDRAACGLRQFPKPRFDLGPEGLRLHPPAGSPAEYLAQHSIPIRSYAWRFTLFGLDLPGPLQRALSGRSAVDRRTRDVARAVIGELEVELASRELDHFFVLFHGRRALTEVGPYTWREPFLYEVMAELGIPFVSSKRPLLEDAAAGRDLASFFPAGDDHYNADGERTVFRALEAGLRGEFEPAEYLAGAPLHPRAER